MAITQASATSAGEAPLCASPIARMFVISEAKAGSVIKGSTIDAPVRVRVRARVRVRVRVRARVRVRVRVRGESRISHIRLHGRRTCSG